MIQDSLGKVSIRSAYRSPDVNRIGNEKGYNCASNEKNHARQYLPAVSRLMAEGLAQPLAMLLDHFYHDSLHVRPEALTTPRRPTEAPDEELLKTLLLEHLSSLSNLNRDRLIRFVPLVTQLMQEGEPEIPALLLADFHARVSDPPRRKSQQDRRMRPERRKGR